MFAFPAALNDYSDWRQVGELMELVPVENRGNGFQNNGTNNEPMMSLSSGGTNVNFWGSGPVSVNIYPGENSHIHFHQGTASNLNYLQPGTTAQPVPHFSPVPNANGHQFEAPNPGNGFRSPSFSDASFFSAASSTSNQQVPNTPSTVAASSGQPIVPTSPTDTDIHRFTPHYSAEYFHEFFDWDLYRERERMSEEQNEPSEQNGPASADDSAAAGASATVPSPPRPRQRSRHTAAPVGRPATRAYTRLQNMSL